MKQSGRYNVLLQRVFDRQIHGTSRQYVCTASALLSSPEKQRQRYNIFFQRGLKDELTKHHVSTCVLNVPTCHLSRNSERDITSSYRGDSKDELTEHHVGSFVLNVLTRDKQWQRYNIFFHWWGLKDELTKHHGRSFASNVHTCHLPRNSVKERYKEFIPARPNQSCMFLSR